MMSESFSCPKCGAALEYKGGSNFTIACPFCGSSVIVPENLRPPLSGTLNPQPGSPVKVDEKNLFQMIQDLLKAGKKNDAVFLYRLCYPKGWSMANTVIDGIEAGTVMELPKIEVDPRILDKLRISLKPRP